MFSRVTLPRLASVGEDQIRVEEVDPAAAPERDYSLGLCRQDQCKSVALCFRGSRPLGACKVPGVTTGDVRAGQERGGRLGKGKTVFYRNVADVFKVSFTG